MASVSVEFHQNIGVMKLNRGITNAINLDLVRELSGSLDKLKDNPDVHGIVLTSANEKFFSIGFAIPELYEYNKEEFHEFYHSFNRLCIDLYRFPKPVIAAINGHATAGGCILALCCDYRFIAAGKKLMGVNEIKLGVPIPFPADCILRELVGFHKAREITDSGNFYLPDQLLQFGMVDKIVPLPQLQSESIGKAQLLGSFPAEGFSMIKQNRAERVEEQIRRHLDKKEQYFLDCWFSESARERLKEAAKKF